MITSENITDIAKAMALAQQQMRPAIKDSTNPHFKSKYSDISSVWEAIREPITMNGMTIWQDVTTQEKAISVTTRIVHSSGQWVEFGPLSIPLSKMDAHGVGSAISYGKRYALCAAVGVVSGDEDDDANLAQGKTQSIPQKHPGHDAFILNNKDKHEYIKVIMATSKKSENEIVAQVLSNIDKFNESYITWKEKDKNKSADKPRSMDEMVDS